MFEQGEGGGCVGISPLGSLGNMTHYSTLSALQREREGEGQGLGQAASLVVVPSRP